MNHSCTKIRRALVTHSHLTFFGKVGKKTKKWQTGPCNAPLFSGEDQETGLCRSCRSGWVHPNNYPADEKRPKRVRNGT